MDNSSSSNNVDNMYNIKVPGHRIAISITASIAAVIATLFNSFVMYVIWKTPSLHKPSYILIANLAVTDFITGSVVLPLDALVNIANILDWKGTFYFAWLSCMAIGFWVGAMSFYIITIISIDRLLAIRLKNRYRSVVTLKRTALVLIIWWVASGTTCITALIIFRVPLDDLVILAAAYQALLLTTLAVCFSMSYRLLKKISSSVVSSNTAGNDSQLANSGQQNFNVNKYRRSLNTMLLVFLCVMIWFSPQLCSHIISLLFFEDALKLDSKNPSTETVYKLLNSGEIVFLMNSSVNPLLYLWRIKDLREAAKKTVRKILRKQTTEQDIQQDTE